MITVSRAFRQELDYNRRNYLSYADITLSTGRTLSLTNSEIWSGGFSTEDAVSEDEKFTALGSTVIGAATLIINNMDESYSSYDFINATVALYTGLWVGSGSSSRLEKIKKGTYTVDDTRYNGGTITLTLLDNMAQFDRPYSTSTLQYPATLDAIVRDACSKCGVLLNTYSFPHKDYVVKVKPQAEAVTYREVVGWAACIAGCFARCNRDGKLELRWFDQDTLETRTDVIDGGRSFDSTSSMALIDGGGFDTSYETIDGGNLYDDDGMHYVHSLYSQDISMDDVVITGVRVTVKNEQEGASTATLDFSAGTSGYVIGVEGNEFITPETGQDVATWLGAQLIGLRFRKASVTHASDPSIEAGDIGILWDRKDNEYPILITRSNFSTTTSQTTVCGAETPSRNNATRYGWQTKSYVDSRRLLFEEESLRNKMLKDLSDRLAAKSGLYSTVEVHEGGDSVYYLHDMPTLDESSIVWKMTREAWGVTTDYNHGVDTVWNGGMTVDGDAIVRILSAIGVNAEWINAGTLVISDGTNTTLSADTSTGQVILCGKDKDGNETFYFNSSTGEARLRPTKLYIAAGQTYQDYIDSSISSAVGGIDTSVSAEDVYNILTNGGKTQGMFITENGHLYLNWEYAKGGMLTLGGGENVYGLLQIQDDRNKKFITLDNEGIRMWWPGTDSSGNDTYSERMKLNSDGFTFRGYGAIGPHINGLAIVTGDITRPLYLRGDLIRLEDAPESFFTDPVLYMRCVHDRDNSNKFIETGSGVSAYGFSDRRAKENISDSDLDYSKIINGLRVVSFDWKKERSHVSAGFIAQEVMNVIPELVVKDPEGMFAINFTGLIPVLVGEAQRQRKMVEAQQQRIADLEDRLAKLEEAIGWQSRR